MNKVARNEGTCILGQHEFRPQGVLDHSLGGDSKALRDLTGRESFCCNVKGGSEIAVFYNLVK